MSKKNKIILDSVERVYSDTKSAIDNKFFRMWLGRFSLPELSRQQERAVKTLFYNNGHCSCIKLDHLEGVEALAFMNYNGKQGSQDLKYDIYGEISDFRVMPKYPNPLINQSKWYTVGEDGVIGFATGSRDSIKSRLDFYSERMAWVEVLIRNNLAVACNMPFLLKNLSPEKRKPLNDVISKILGGEIVIEMTDDLDELEVLATNVQYLAPELRAIYYDYYSQAKEWLGIDTVQLDSSSKQWQSVEQVDGNNAVINILHEDINNSIQTFLDEIKETFGVTITFKDNLEMANSLYEDGEDNKQPGLKDNKEDNKDE